MFPQGTLTLTTKLGYTKTVARISYSSVLCLQQFESAVLLTGTSLHLGEHFRKKLTDTKAGKGRRRFAKQVHTITESVLKRGKIQQQLSHRVKNFGQYGLLRHKPLPVCITGHFYVQKGGDRSNTSHFDGDFSHKSQTRHPFPNQTILNSSRWSSCDSVSLSHVLHVPWLVTETEVAVSVSLAVWTCGLAVFFWPHCRHFCLLTRYCNFYSTFAAVFVYSSLKEHF